MPKRRGAGRAPSPPRRSQDVLVVKNGKNSKVKTNDIKTSLVQYECEFCDKSFMTTVGLRRHMKYCVKNPTKMKAMKAEVPPSIEIHVLEDKFEKLITANKPAFKCKDCNKKFKFEQSYKTHIHDVHSKSPKSVKCDQCSARCPNKKILEEHIQKCHRKKSFECPHCKKAFTRYYHVTRHLEQKGCDGQSPIQFPCEICDQVFARKDNLVIHLRWHVNKRSAQSFNCKLCTASFIQHNQLLRHVNKEHSEKHYECNECGRVVNARGAMIKHLEIHGEKKYGCNKCDYTSHTLEVMRRHMLRHTPNKPFQCHLCPRSFIQSHQLTAHVFIHTGQSQYMCEVCSEAFNSKGKLILHNKRVHEGVPDLVCPVPDCKSSKRTFKYKESFKQHMKLHDKFKPYPCRGCNKSFPTQGLLKSHALTHQLERPRRCLYCVQQRAYIRGDMLLRHLRMKHPAIFREHLAHMRQVMGFDGLDNERMRKDERGSLINMLDALQENVFNNEGLTPSDNASEETQSNDTITSIIKPLMSEEELAEKIKKLLTHLIDEETLTYFGWPDKSVDEVLEKVIEQCGQRAADRTVFTRVQCLRENAKHLFLHVIEDEAVGRMLATHTIDQVVCHVVAASQQ